MKVIVYSEDPNFKARELEMDENFVNDYPEIDTGLLHIDNAPKICYGYARFVIGGRWPEGEEYIMKNPMYAYAYACGILKDRWPEAEEVIKKDPEWWDEYAYVMQGSKGL